MRHLPFFLLIFCFGKISYSQEILLKGKITADSLLEASVHIVNLTQKTGVVNTSNGEFQIKAEINDSIIFSSVQYESHQIVVSEEIVQHPYIEINLKLLELEEVRISDVSLSGYLERDLQEIPTFNQADFGFPHSKKSRPPVPDRAFFVRRRGPVGFLVSAFSGDLASIKRGKEMQARYMLVEKAKRRTNSQELAKVLDVEPEETVNFLYYCEETDPDFESKIDSLTELELVAYYKSMLLGFLERKAGENR